MHDDPLGLNQGHAPPSGVWKLPQQEPTNLIALWPHDEAPTQPEIIAALEAHWDGVQIVDEIQPEEKSMPWAFVVNSDAIHEAAILWCEPARPMPPGELDDPRAEACKWVIGIESQLNPEQPLESYRDLVRFIAAPFDEVPGILDVNTTGWIQRQAILEQFLPDDNVPPIDVLWIVHAVSPSDAARESENSGDSGGVWLHTHGLWRCGRPELEMLEVDQNYASMGGNLINEIAERILDDPPTPPGEAFHLGDNLAVTLHPWQDLMENMTPGTPGGKHDRDQDESGAHTGVRAVICDSKPHGTFKKIWVWPKASLDSLHNDQAVIWKSTRATQRIAMQAKYTWGELATAFAKLSPYLAPSAETPKAVVLIKSGFTYRPDGDDEDSTEHMWLEVRRFEGEHVEGRLLNEPMFIPDIRIEESIRVPREDLSDWIVKTEVGSFGPCNVKAMWRDVDRIASTTTLPPREARS
ncbi:MAG: DUF4026 domain-containing protein [Planctomycetota bacterium]|nr:DUF4026 domain-containing protein [Planctomycetota bacterium]